MGASGLCAKFHKAVELIGRRWSGAIIRILLNGPARYAELRSAIPDITDRMLSERLRELEDEAIVARTVVPDTPVRVEYALTAKGRALAPALAAIGQWADRWLEVDAPRAAPVRPTSRKLSRAAERPRRALRQVPSR